MLIACNYFDFELLYIKGGYIDMIVANINAKSKKFRTTNSVSGKCNCGMCNCNCGSQIFENGLNSNIQEIIK